MLFHVGGLLREPVGSMRRHVVAAEPPLRRGTVEMVRLPGGVLVRFEGDTVVEAECSRCLNELSYPQHLEFDEIYVQQVDPGTGERVAADLGQDEETFRVELDHTIDITEAVRQYTEVAAAMQPLCRPDCPGLCAQCGQDLTVRTCSCDRAPADSRWAALSKLKQFPNG